MRDISKDEVIDALLDKINYQKRLIEILENKCDNLLSIRDISQTIIDKQDKILYNNAEAETKSCEVDK